MCGVITKRRSEIHEFLRFRQAVNDVTQWWLSQVALGSRWPACDRRNHGDGWRSWRHSGSVGFSDIKAARASIGTRGALHWDLGVMTSLRSDCFRSSCVNLRCSAVCVVSLWSRRSWRHSYLKQSGTFASVPAVSSFYRDLISALVFKSRDGLNKTGGKCGRS